MKNHVSALEDGIEETKVGKIFTPTNIPTYTYIPRDQFSLGKKLKQYYENTDSIIVITGESKSGKTVLWKKIIDENYVEIDAINIKTIDDLWSQIINKTNITLNKNESLTESKTESLSASVSGKGSVVIASVKGDVEGRDENGVSKTTVREKLTILREIALNKLITDKITLVIEDFHYIDENIQTEIARSIKNQLPKGLKVIILAVPHKVSAVIKAEKDLQGRVKNLQIPKWRPEEIQDIAKKGFKELNLSYSEELVKNLSEESFFNPGMMQNLCLNICLDNDIGYILKKPKEINFPNNDKYSFYSNFASIETDSDTYLRLISKGKTKGRSTYKFTDDTSGDTYVGVLKAISNLFPKVEMTHSEINKELDNIILGDKKIQGGQITQTLNYMTKNEKEYNSKYPVLEYDDLSKRLIILDHFFAFNLKWGNHE